MNKGDDMIEKKLENGKSKLSSESELLMLIEIVHPTFYRGLNWADTADITPWLYHQY